MTQGVLDREPLARKRRSGEQADPCDRTPARRLRGGRVTGGKQTNTQTNERTNKQTNKQTNEQTTKQTKRQANKTKTNKKQTKKIT